MLPTPKSVEPTKKAVQSKIWIAFFVDFRCEIAILECASIIDRLVFCM